MVFDMARCNPDLAMTIRKRKIFRCRVRKMYVIIRKKKIVTPIVKLLKKYMRIIDRRFGEILRRGKKNNGTILILQQHNPLILTLTSFEEVTALQFDRVCLWTFDKTNVIGFVTLKFSRPLKTRSNYTVASRLIIIHQCRYRVSTSMSNRSSH